MNDEQHRLIKDIFLECSKLEDEERRRCVERRCGDNVAMRREVELLLAHHKSSTIMPASNRDSSPSKAGSRSSNRSRSRGSRTRTAWRRALNQWADRLSVSGQMALGAAVTLLLVFGMAWWSQHSIATSSRNYWAHGFTAMLKATMDKIAAGHGTQFDLREIEQLDRVLHQSAHCGLGHTACNPTLDTLKRFRPTYERRLKSLDFVPAFDLDGALAAARRMTGRDDAGAHLNTEEA